MTLVRGSTDRLKLDWEHDDAVGPDGTSYHITSEKLGAFSERAYIAVIHRPGKSYQGFGRGSEFGEDTPGNPYQDEPLTRAGQRKVCEWDAWDRAGRP